MGMPPKRWLRVKRRLERRRQLESYALSFRRGVRLAKRVALSGGQKLGIENPKVMKGNGVACDKLFLDYSKDSSQCLIDFLLALAGLVGKDVDD